MDLTPAEQHILDRFAEKCRIAGGPRIGYVLRKRAICFSQEDHPELDLEAGLSALVDKELLKTNESGDLYFLSAAGAERLTEMNEGVGR